MTAVYTKRMTKSALTRKTNQTVDQILATMTDDEIANMTDEQMEAIAEQVADTVIGV